MKAIVTGANGFVGSELIKKLVSLNIPVLAIDVSFQNMKLPDNDLIVKKESCLTDTKELINNIPVGEYDVFYNFAWRGVNGQEKASYEVQLNNIMISLRCAEIAKAIGCKKYLSAGTIAEKSVESLDFLKKTSGGMMYGAAKFSNHVILETYCKNINLDFVWMQFSNIFGPLNKTGNLISYTIEQLKKGEPATFGPAKQPYDFIYIDDIIEAIYKLGLMKTNHNMYFIGSGQPRILSEYLLSVGKIFGRPDLIQIGAREDDGIKYIFDMLNTQKLQADIGKYVFSSFEERIKYTIKKY